MYGGKLAENLVQAVARDVFAEALIRLVHAGIEVVFHCHDEVVCEVPLDTDPADIERLMSITPDWLSGCPLAAESVETEHYLK
jgi:DNA polymerase